MTQTTTRDEIRAKGEAAGTTRLVLTQRRARAGQNRWRNVLLAVWVPIVGLLLWYVLSLNSQSPFFPPLKVILIEWWNDFIIGDSASGNASLQILPSLRNLAIGYIAGILIGYIAGVILYRLPWVRRATNPLVYFLYVLPAPALLPAMIAIFGIGDMRQIALISFGAIWPTLLNTLDGMRSIDQVKFDNARAMRFSSLRTLMTVVIPGSGPQAAAGLRASLQVSIILMVIAEMVAANTGLGYFILNAQTQFAIVTMWAGIFTLAIIGTVLNYIFVGVEHVVLRWYYRSRAVTG